SSRMIALARQLTEKEHITNAVFRQADAQGYPFSDRYFDIAISRHGTMFFGDAAAAFINIGRAMRRGGRLVMLSWQALECNEWISEFRAALAVGRELPMPPPGAPGPFSLSDRGYVHDLLASAGFANIRLQGLSEPMYFGCDVEDSY